MDKWQFGHAASAITRLRADAGLKNVKNAGQKKTISNLINRNLKKEVSADEKVEMLGLRLYS